ncbi:hypothetical protein DFH27DRAFT_612177 [Peziza echinospora]|nr:hypothetical protein DFH27DRAFT_612177 [Peziza echinospora]
MPSVWPRSSESTPMLPAMFPPSKFDQAVREGDQFHRRPSSNTRDSISGASPVSPTSHYPPPTAFSSSKYQLPSASSVFISPPESRRSSAEDSKRQSISSQLPPHAPPSIPQTLPSLHEVGLVPSSSIHSSNPSAYSLHSHPPLPPVHPQGPNHAISHPSPPHSSPYNGSHQPPPPPLGRPSEPRYDYHDGRNSYGQQGQPTPVHPNPEPYPSRSNSYPQSSYPTPRSHPSSTHSSMSGPPSSHFGYQSGQAQQSPTSTNQQTYQPHTMPPPYGPYHHEQGSPHGSGYQSSSPGSKVLGKRPSTGSGYGGAIERALQVSSMRRDLETSRNRSQSIFNLTQHLYEKNGSGYHGLGVILDDFNKAVQDASELKEGLEGCRRLIAEMCKDEQEQQCVADKSLPHVPEYEIEEHGGYADDMRGSGMQQPELKKMRRGRAAPPGRCHSCHRAETPEWRRGPDGARTLCNACGLHYAKLTRKMSKSNLAPNTMVRKSPNASLA